MKFKIGDRVRVVSANEDIGYQKYIGETGTVSVFPFAHTIYIRNDFYGITRINVTLDMDIGKAHYTDFREQDLEFENVEINQYEEWDG